MAELKRSVGFWTIVALTITAMIGTGMFFGTAIGAGYSGNAVLVAWAILLVVSLYVAACFGELIALFPKAGGVYEFSKQAYGRFFSFLIGWVTWMMANISVTVLIVAALEHLLPPGFATIYKILIAIGLIIVLNIITYLGVDTSAAALMFFAIISIVLLIAIIVPGAFQINLANFKPFFSKPHIFIFVSLFFMLEALMGWEEASFLAEETKNPEKTIPKALIVSTLIAGILSLGIAFVSLGIIPWQKLTGSTAPITDVTAILFGSLGSQILGVGIILALIGAAAGIVITTPRLLLAMARDKLFIAQLAAIHEKKRTPYKAIIFQTIVSIVIIIIGFGQYKVLLSMFTPLALIMYIAVLLSVTILRFKLRDANRAFKAPLGVIGPVVISLIYAGTIVAWLLLEPGAFALSRIILSLILFAIPIYLLLIFFYNPDAIVGFSNYFAKLTLWTENLLLPKRMRRKIIGLFKDLDKKIVLEYGAGVGTLTLHLAQAVGAKGKVYATDLSKKNIKLLTNRLLKKGISHVTVIHDEHQVNRVHPSIQSVDIIFSVGMMSYMQDFKKILKEMNRILPDGGRVCFVEYVNFFRILPDAEWVSDIERLKKIFRESGFSVKIEKKHGFLWNYLFVYGIKSERDVPMV
ncbi:amino acid permease, partial [Candidatus Woesearchaeota archaeon]|nr:amino acid permease [Candidatus Woesearchaeota archaeon]